MKQHIFNLNPFQLCQCHEVKFGSVCDIISGQAHHLNCDRKTALFDTENMLWKLQSLKKTDHDQSTDTSMVTDRDDAVHVDKKKGYAHIVDASIVTDGKDLLHVAKKAGNDLTRDASIMTDIDDAVHVAKKINNDQIIEAISTRCYNFCQMIHGVVDYSQDRLTNKWIKLTRQARQNVEGCSTNIQN